MGIWKPPLFKLHIGLGSRRALLPRALHGLGSTEPPAHPQRVIFSPLFLLICEQIPLGRVPGRAWAAAGTDLELGGAAGMEMLLQTLLQLPASPQIPHARKTSVCET